MHCGKKPYLTRQEAKKALKLMNKTLGFTLTDVYFCNDCNAWHTTHMPKKKSRSIKHNTNWHERVSEELRELRKRVKKNQ